MHEHFSGTKAGALLILRTSYPNPSNGQVKESNQFEVSYFSSDSCDSLKNCGQFISRAEVSCFDTPRVSRDAWWSASRLGVAIVHSIYRHVSGPSTRLIHADSAKKFQNSTHYAFVRCNLFFVALYLVSAFLFCSFVFFLAPSISLCFLDLTRSCDFLFPSSSLALSLIYLATILTLKTPFNSNLIVHFEKVFRNFARLNQKVQKIFSVHKIRQIKKHRAMSLGKWDLLDKLKADPF